MKGLVISVLLISAAVAGIAWLTTIEVNTPISPAKPARADIDQGPTRRDELVQITPKRVQMSRQTAVLCVPPQSVFGPHDVAEILIFANPVALDYRRKHPDGIEYPIGSKFVKEKYAAESATTPESATVMTRKSLRGDVSDWEFVAISLPDRTPIPTASGASCADCHAHFADRGYISTETEETLRRYLQLD